MERAIRIQTGVRAGWARRVCRHRHVLG